MLASKDFCFSPPFSVSAKYLLFFRHYYWSVQKTFANSHKMALLHCWIGWQEKEKLLSHSVCWRSPEGAQTRESREWTALPADSEKTQNIFRIYTSSKACSCRGRKHKPLRSIGRQRCVWSWGSSALGWLSGECPWTPAERRWPLWAAARPGSGSYRNHPSENSPYGGLWGRKSTGRMLALTDEKRQHIKAWGVTTSPALMGGAFPIPFLAINENRDKTPEWIKTR